MVKLAIFRYAPPGIAEGNRIHPRCSRKQETRHSWVVAEESGGGLIRTFPHVKETSVAKDRA